MKRVRVIGCLAVLLSGCVAGHGGVVTGNEGGVDRRDASGNGGRDGGAIDGGHGSRDGGGMHGFDAATLPDGSVPPREIYCGDGVDNDFDELTDCADEDCANVSCDDAMGYVCVDSSCGGCTHEAVETDCADGADEDCDGPKDCADSDCDGARCNARGDVCAAGSCPCADRETCDNGIDDDCDSLVDCTDSMDCEAFPCSSASGFVCMTGMCVCTSSFEACNDHDEDCDGVADNGCPSGIAYCCPAPAGSFGSPGGSVFSDPCPMGTALIGMAGRASTRIDQLQPVCASFVLETDRSPGHFEFAYPIRRGAAILGAMHGGSGGTAFDDRCPGNDVVIGISGTADDIGGLSSMVLRCGTLATAHVGLTWRLTITPSVDLPMRGSASATPFASDCGNGAVSEIGGGVGSTVQRIAITCEQIQLQTL